MALQRYVIANNVRARKLIDPAIVPPDDVWRISEDTSRCTGIKLIHKEDTSSPFLISLQAIQQTHLVYLYRV